MIRIVALSIATGITLGILAALIYLLPPGYQRYVVKSGVVMEVRR